MEKLKPCGPLFGVQTAELIGISIGRIGPVAVTSIAAVMGVVYG